MSTITQDSDSWIGATLVDGDQRKVGRIEEIYLDEDSRPAWMVVRMGRIGARQSFVPVAGAVPAGGAVMAPYDRREIEDAPRLEPAEDLADDDVRDLYLHYGLLADIQVARDPAGPRLGVAERVLMYV